MKLISITPREPLKLPGTHPTNLQTIMVGQAPWADWRITVDGGVVLLESPPGWSPSPERKAEPNARRVFEVARSACNLQWDPGAGEAEYVKRWSSAEEEMERLTQPKGKAK